MYLLSEAFYSFTLNYQLDSLTQVEVPNSSVSGALQPIATLTSGLYMPFRMSHVTIGQIAN